MTPTPFSSYHCPTNNLERFYIIMQKLLIYITCCTILLLSGCKFDPLSWTHRIDIQQGNIINQEDVDQLKPGMNKNQVRYIMGTPLLQDPFHADRWDYVYRLKKGGGEQQQKRLSVEFTGGKLSRIFGDLHPDPDATPRMTKPSINIDVPYQERKEEGLLTRWFKKLTNSNED